jgi:hypothetical protein
MSRRNSPKRRENRLIARSIETGRDPALKTNNRKRTKGRFRVQVVQFYDKVQKKMVTRRILHDDAMRADVAAHK